MCNEAMLSPTVESPNHSLVNLSLVMDNYVRNLYLNNDTAGILLIAFYVPVFVTSLLGNSSVLLILILRKKLRTVTNMLLSNMAVADLSVSVVCMPMAVGQTVYKVWIYGDAMCKLTGFFQGLAVVASIFTIAILSFDRLLAIRYPYVFRRLSTNRVAVRLTAVVWALSVGTMAPLLSMRKLNSLSLLPQEEPLYFCNEIWPSIDERRAYDISLFFIVYVIPGLIIITSYSLIGRQLMTEDKNLNRTESEISKGIARHVMNGRKRVAKMLIVLAGLFVFCWLPYHVVSLYLDFEMTRAGEFLIVLPYTILLGHLNSAINPLLYFYVSKSFRKCLKKLITCKKYRFARHAPVHVVVRFSAEDGSVRAHATKKPLIRILSTASFSRSSGSLRFSRSTNTSLRSSRSSNNSIKLQDLQKTERAAQSAPLIQVWRDTTAEYSPTHQRCTDKHRRDIFRCSLNIPTTINEESSRMSKSRPSSPLPVVCNSFEYAEPKTAVPKINLVASPDRDDHVRPDSLLEAEIVCI